MGSQMNANSLTRNRIAAACGAIVIVVVALALFMNANTARISAQNAEYLEGSTEQTARRIDDLVTNGLAGVRTAASVYQESLTGPVPDPRRAVSMANRTQFDYVFFVTPDGVAYNGDGREERVLDREYYARGMQGESGVSAIAHAAFDEQNVMVFYAPVSYEGQVVGVFVCAYREDTLTRFMTTSFFGVQTATYLCESDGTIVASSADVSNEDGESTFDLFVDLELDGEGIEQLSRGAEDGDAVGFAYEQTGAAGNAYLTKLPSYDWLILRTFPESITKSMVENANRAGMILVVGILVAGALFIVVLMLQARKQKDQLLLERQEATRIIDASTNLFSRLLAVDLVAGTYQYLKSDGLDSAMGTGGRYTDLLAFWVDSVNPEDRSQAIAALDPQVLRRDLRPEVPYLQKEYRTSRDGQEYWLQVSTLCVARDRLGRPTDVLVVIQDVTEAKSRELASRQALEDAFRAAEHASQAKSDFLNSMSHDIRTPMNSIMGLTAIASMHVEDADRVRECLANISSASRHLLGLINEVLDMAKIESGSIGLSEEEFVLSETVESLLSIVHPQITAKDQVLKVDLVDIEHEHVLGDPTRLQQVFVNIMGNAVKFTPEGGSIGLRITELPSRIAGSGCFEFIFTDTGCGMSEEFMETVFEPFTRANDSRTTKVEGTGLGMAIVKSVVSLMNGTVDVSSVLGEGTTFTVTVHLKLRDGRTEDLSELAGVRVLVVDDDEIACEAAAALLTDIGMAPSYATSGPDGVEAVAQAERDGEPFCAVILDWRMPGMSGLEAAKAIRESAQAQVPIIILSGYDWSMIEQEAREVGVDAFISKPLFRTRLVSVMKDLIGGGAGDGADQRALLEECRFAGRRILLTEDNAMAAEIAKEIIGMTGADVEHAENGQLAVRMLEEHEPGYYDVVLMDIQMPVMNGYEATEAIRRAGEQRPDLAEIPIIAQSADAFAEDVKRSRDAGMNAHLAKPLEIEALVKMLGEWMPPRG